MKLPANITSVRRYLHKFNQKQAQLGKGEVSLRQFLRMRKKRAQSGKRSFS